MEAPKQIKRLTEDLLKRLEVPAKVEVIEDETGAFRVNIDTEETGLLIGFHGQTLESLQILLGIIVSRKLGSFERVYVNVGDYREKRGESRMFMAQRAAERVMTLGRPVQLT